MKDALIDRHGDDERYVVFARDRFSKKRKAVTNVLTYSQALAWNPSPVDRTLYRNFRINLYKP